MARHRGQLTAIYNAIFDDINALGSSPVDRQVMMSDMTKAFTPVFKLLDKLEIIESNTLPLAVIKGYLDPDQKPVVRLDSVVRYVTELQTEQEIKAMIHDHVLCQANLICSQFGANLTRGLKVTRSVKFGKYCFDLMVEMEP